MNRIPQIAAFIMLSAGIAAAQAVPSRTPPPDPDEVVKISTALVRVDVTVTDRKGRTIRDLKAEDFEIFENGEKQNISSFSFVSSTREAAAADERPEPGKPLAPRPPVEVRPENVRRTFALVVDDLSLSFESAYQTRRSLKKFVDEQMQDGDLVAIIRTGAGIGALQQFTSNRQQLHAAVEKVRWNPTGRGGIGAFAPIEPSPLELAKAAGDATVSDEDLEQEKNFNNSIEDFRSAQFATGTLGALKYIIGGMGELPGRKSVILFSDGFRLSQRDSQGFSDGGRVIDFLTALVDAANRASVVFYTIDPRGLQTTGLTAQDQVTSPTPQALQTALSERRDELLETQDGLRYLARETGGIAIVNNNDLIGGMRRILDDQSYYLIGYEPNDDTFDAAKRRFNKIDVRVKREGAMVRNRSGFINVADERIAKAAPPARTPVQQIQAALVSPFGANDISLRLNPLFGNDAIQGNFVRSLLHVDAGSLTFTDEPDGTKKAVFDVLAMSFGDNGQPVDSIAKTYTMNVNKAVYEKFRQDGFIYHFTFPVKKPGPYQYRVAIRDSRGGKVGSASQFIEVPDIKKKRLTLSSLILQSFTDAQWKIFTEDSSAAATEYSSPQNDTAIRRFKLDSVLRYGFEIYNPKLDAARRPAITTKLRIFRGQTLVLDGKEVPLPMEGQTDMLRLKAAGAVRLAREMEPGDYILQVIVTDNMAGEKRRIATQYVQFELVR